MLASHFRVVTDEAGQWPSVVNQDTYIGLMRFDLKWCGGNKENKWDDTMLSDLEWQEGLILSFGDKQKDCYKFDAITYNSEPSWKSKRNGESFVMTHKYSMTSY